MPKKSYGIGNFGLLWSVSILIVVEYAQKATTLLSKLFINRVSILIVVEYAQKVKMKAAYKYTDGGLNPYCCGICPKSMFILFDVVGFLVSILIVVEYAQKVKQTILVYEKIVSLNPYCCGICPKRNKKT